MTLTGPVWVVGTGLLGTSVALACRRKGLEVLLTDTAPEHLRTATGLGAGRPFAPGDRPQLVVVAVPPARLGEVVARCLRETDAVVTDLGSIKAQPLREVTAAVSAGELPRYVGSHPMAGTEHSGPLTATASLFDARPWAVTPGPRAAANAVALVQELAGLCGAVPVVLDPEDHDRAVARISHLPYVMSVLTAGQLVDAPTEHLALSGPGVRDVTRVAGSDPQLWQQIVAGNSAALLERLAAVRDQLDVLIAAVAAPGRPELAEVLEQGAAGTRAIPGKHGGPSKPTCPVFVSVPDHPGELARLFADAGASGVNIEDVFIDHDPGRPTGLVELVVSEASADQLLESLESQGWATHR